MCDFKTHKKEVCGSKKFSVVLFNFAHSLLEDTGRVPPGACKKETSEKLHTRNEEPCKMKGSEFLKYFC